jgi:hypothetical protein
VTILDSVKDIDMDVQRDTIWGKETTQKVRPSELPPVFTQRSEAASKKALDPVKDSSIILVEE